MPAPDTTPRVILAQALTQEAFAAYGALIAPGQSERDINFGTTRRYDDVASLDVEDEGGRACVAIFRTQAQGDAKAYPLCAFERHRLGSQSFIPLGASRCLAVVAGDGELPDEFSIAAFVVEPGQGITLRRGVWHHPLITIGAANVLVIERMGKVADCQVIRAETRTEVVLPQDS